MNVRPFAHRTGLTLLELLCALAIAALLLASLLGTLTLTARAMTDAGQSARQCRLVAGIERVVRRDLQGACRTGDRNAVSFIARPNASVAEPTLEFFTTNTFVSGAMPGDGASRVQYFLRPVEGREGVQDLLRREAPFTPGKALPDRPAERLLAGLTFWRASFYDGYEWLAQWKRDTLPVMVRLEMAFEGEPGRPVHEMVFSALVTSRADPSLP